MVNLRTFFVITDSEATLTVVKAFQTNEDLGDMRYDPRGYQHLLGRAIHVIYTSSLDSGDFTNHSVTYNIDRLVRSAVDACSPIFHRRGYSMGIGMYSDGLYVDARDTFDLWTDDTALIPAETTLDEYKGEMSTRIQFALGTEHIYYKLSKDTYILLLLIMVYQH